MSKPTLLLVDDEVDLLQVMSAALRHALPEHQVLAVSSTEEAEEAVADLEATGRVLALVVVDQVLGGSTGLDLVASVRTRFPDVPALLVTGQAPPDIEREAAALDTRVLWKPMRLSVLLEEVSRQLGARS